MLAQLVIGQNTIYPALLDQSGDVFPWCLGRTDNDSVSYPIQFYKSQGRGELVAGGEQNRTA
jgi:hypothetical protein